VTKNQAIQEVDWLRAKLEAADKLTAEYVSQHDVDIRVMCESLKGALKRAEAAEAALDLFVDLKYGHVGLTLRLLQEGHISYSKACEVLAELAHGGDPALVILPPSCESA
jgi:hypothetical protein